MPAAVLDLILFTGDDGRPAVALGEEQYATLADLVQGVPDLKAPEQLVPYCAAVNHLNHGYEYRLILAPEEYKAQYEARLNAEPPHQPMQGDAVRLRQFGLCDTSSLEPPRREAQGVVFFVEDRFLGIPYRVTAPAPDHPDGAADYDPLPMTPLPESPDDLPPEEPAGPVQEAIPVTVKVEPAPKPVPLPSPVAVSPRVPARTAPVAAVPPPPSPLDLLRDAVTREDQAAVRQHLLTLGVERKVCDRILATWEGIVDTGNMIAQRRAKMLDLITFIRSLTSLPKAQEELWQLQKALTRYN